MLAVELSNILPSISVFKLEVLDLTRVVIEVSLLC